MTGVSAERIVEVYPRLYHMAHIDSWPSISKHGLLSTTALLDLLGIDGTERVRIISRHRPDSIHLHDKKHGDFVIRDQKPMSDNALEKCLKDGLVPRDWYELLNRHVFFWPTERRLHRMASARAYRSDRHAFLVVDTKSLLSKHMDDILLSPINSGCTVPARAERGRTTFRPPNAHPFEARKASRGEGFAELLVKYAVPDIVDHVLEVYVGQETRRLESLYAK